MTPEQELDDLFADYSFEWEQHSGCDDGCSHRGHVFEFRDKVLAWRDKHTAKAVRTAEIQGAFNAYMNLKTKRIAHKLQTPVKEWVDEIEFIDRQMLGLQQPHKSIGGEDAS